MALADFFEALTRQRPRSMAEAMFGMRMPSASPMGGQLPPSAFLPGVVGAGGPNLADALRGGGGAAPAAGSNLADAVRARVPVPGRAPSAGGPNLASAVRQPRPAPKPSGGSRSSGSSAASAMRNPSGRNLASSVRGPNAPGVQMPKPITRRPEPAPGRFMPGPVNLPRAPQTPGRMGDRGPSRGGFGDALRRKRNPFDFG